MARSLRIQYPGAHYHVTCRGNERRRIFDDEKDRSIFLEKLAASLEIYDVVLLAYVCMSNHFHLLVKTPRANLSEFMRHFNISYTTTYNYRHRRIGHLYQGRYKAFLVDADSYLVEVSRYIHLNPVCIKAMEDKSIEDRWQALRGYRWSSLLGYLYPRQRVKFIDYKVILGYRGGDDASGRDGYRRFIGEGINRKVKNPLELGMGHGIVGDKEFIEWVKIKVMGECKSKREQPAVRELGKRLEPEELINRYAQVVGKNKEEICRRGRKLLERSMLMESLYRLCNLSQPEIGRLVGGIDYSAVSQARKRLQNNLASEPVLRARFDKILEKLYSM